MPDIGIVPPPSRKPGRFRRAARFIVSPRHYVPVDDIHDGWRFIGDLTRVIRNRRRRSRKIRLGANGHFDIQAMAFDAGTTVPEVERRLTNRRVQTRRNTWAYLGLGCLLLVAWGGGGIGVGRNSLIDIVLFLAVIACFFVSAFHNALINWQVRTRRLGSISEFLRTEDSWWPS